MTLAISGQWRKEKRSPRILLVEDSDTVRVLTTEYLRSAGHDVVDVDSAEQALILLANDSFDVLFTDMSLPGMSGADLVNVVLQQHPLMAIVVSSGFDVIPGVDFPETTGVRFLPKPYDLTALNRALNAIQAPE